MRPRNHLAAGLLAVLLALFLCACSGGGGSGESDLTPGKVLALAKHRLDETSGVHLRLHTDNLPSGVTGVEDAEGVGTHAPAFDGKITVVLSGQAFEVPVIAVDHKIWVQLPLTTGWQDIDPAEYGAPDPAQLMSTQHGFSSLLPATTDVKKGRSVRGGKDNKEVLTEYTGTLDGAAVQRVIPTASGQFDATYTITDDHVLREADLTGVFYPHSDPMTYVVTFDDYGIHPGIEAPTG